MLSAYLGFLHFDEENMLLTVKGCKELEYSLSQLTSGRDSVLLQNFILLTFVFISYKNSSASKPITSELNNQIVSWIVDVFRLACRENFPLHIL